MLGAVHRLLAVLVLASVMAGCERGAGVEQPARARDDAWLIADHPKVVEQDVRARRSGETVEKVYGGEPVLPGTFAATVGITRGVDPRPACTGILIEPDVVLTAAHCVCGVVANSAGAADANVYVGDNASVSGAGLYYRVVAFESAISCRGQELASSPKQNKDLALLRLRAKVKGVTPAVFAADANVDTAVSYRVVGFGAIDQAGTDYPLDKREAKVVAVSNDCRGHKDDNPHGPTDEAYYGCNPGSEIVAGQRQSPDSCNGDSGGPLYVSASGKGWGVKPDAYRVAGVVARSISDSPSRCGNGGVYERLNANARSWIASARTRLQH